MKGAERRSIFPSIPSIPFVLDCFRRHIDLNTSLNALAVIKERERGRERERERERKKERERERERDRERERE